MIAKKGLGFCLPLAVIAAAIANPILELASNAGVFGRSGFTDHSNLDVVPTLVVGILLMGLYFVQKARAVVECAAFSRGVIALLPVIFLLQIATLYVMESAEQLVVWGHILGPMLWLGAPPAISLAFHAAVCIAVTLWITRSSPALARTTLRVIRVIRAIATLAPQTARLILRDSFSPVAFERRAPLLCRIGERAPPISP
ncbi:MAG: hypothetical protein JO101_07565 [Candidatus Eremiobacteraeota bacterium]|nr:hypothetical protein [Candidatus Eremiobacteraeota bacterium]MBV8355160.1 hypothetical protein [Candidatus Eremiobacteraeota bacterium]